MSLTMNTILLILFQMKHEIGDFALQTAYMQKKALAGWDWVLPLTAHCLVHGGMTLMIVLFLDPKMAWLSLVDFGIHFVVDRTKALVSRDSIPWSLPFRVAFSLDQILHFLTNLLIIHLLGY